MSKAPHESADPLERENWRRAEKRLLQIQSEVDALTAASNLYTAGDGLTLTGSDFDVNVDNSTIEINADALRVKDGGITSAKILDGTIANADVNASAAIDATKIHDGSISNTEFGYLNGVTSAIQTQIDGKLGTAHESDTSNVHGITDTTKQVPVKIFQPGARTLVQAATTANITLSGTQTVDGVALGVGDKCLVKDQTTGSENGVYVVAAGAWSRDTGSDSADEVYTGIIMTAYGGATNGGLTFVTSNLTPPSIGSDTITYVEMNSALSGVDTTPANRFALDLLSFLEGNQLVQGLWEMTDLTVGNITAGNAVIAGVDDGAIAVIFSSSDIDGTPATAFTDYASGGTIFVSGEGKVSTDAGLPLELKSGSGSTSNQSYVYINGGVVTKMVYKSANYTVTIGDREIIYTGLAATRTDTLPLLADVPDGWECIFGDGTSAGAAGTYNLIINEHATDGGSEVARLATNNHFVKVKKINGKWWRGPYEIWTRTA